LLVSSWCFCVLSLPQYLIYHYEVTFFIYLVGIRDYCERYGANIKHVCEEQGGPRSLSGETLDKLEKELNQTMPLEQLNERRSLRDKRLAALAIHRQHEDKENES